jgi:phage-related holin
MFSNLKKAIALSTWWAFAYLWISQEAITILAILMLIDFITWLISSYRDKNTQISSTKWKRWIAKKMILLMIPLTVALMMRWIWLDWDRIVGVTLWILIVMEWYSVLWNIYNVITWEKKPESEAVKKLLEALFWLMDGLLHKLLSSIEWEKK